MGVISFLRNVAEQTSEEAFQLCLPSGDDGPDACHILPHCEVVGRSLAEFCSNVWTGPTAVLYLLYCYLALHVEHLYYINLTRQRKSGPPEMRTC